MKNNNKPSEQGLKELLRALTYGGLSIKESQTVTNAICKLKYSNKDIKEFDQARDSEFPFEGGMSSSEALMQIRDNLSQTIINTTKPNSSKLPFTLKIIYWFYILTGISAILYLVYSWIIYTS